MWVSQGKGQGCGPEFLPHLRPLVLQGLLFGLPLSPGKPEPETRDSRASVHAAVGPRPLPPALLPPPRLPWGRPTRSVLLLMHLAGQPRGSHLGGSSP